MEYPKLLIVGVEDIFKTKNSSAITAMSFLEDWPEDRLRQIVCGDAVPNSRTFVLTKSDKWLSCFFARKKVRPASINRNDSRCYKRDTSLRHIIHQRLVYLYTLLPYYYRKDLRHFVDEYSPDIIYSYHGGCGTLSLINKISQKKRIPLIPHFLDDWPNFVCEESKLFRGVSLSLIKRAIIKAPVVFCISELMCKEYEQRYKQHKFVPLMHSVNPTFEDSDKVDSHKTLLYAGSLYFGRQDTLIKFCEVISKNGYTDVSIVIYTNPNGWEELKDYFSPYSFVQYGGFVSHEELMQHIEKSYGLIFVESFDEEPLKYTRLSLSTKVPEYLASGRPVLAIGNKKQGSIAYLRDNNAAYCVDNMDELEKVVIEFLEQKNWMEKEKNAKVLFSKFHEKGLQKKRFHDIIGKCVLSNK